VTRGEFLAPIERLGGDGLSMSWREYQHLDDERDSPAFPAGQS
jgi:hypothetical protein